MVLKVYYWTDAMLMVRRPNDNDVKNYVALPMVFDDKETPNSIFERLNREGNPMSSPAMQDWIRRHLQPSPHTSMSVGDLVVYPDGMTMRCADVGWERLSWRLP